MWFAIYGTHGVPPPGRQAIATRIRHKPQCPQYSPVHRNKVGSLTKLVDLTYSRLTNVELRFIIYTVLMCFSSEIFLWHTVGVSEFLSGTLFVGRLMVISRGTYFDHHLVCVM